MVMTDNTSLEEHNRTFDVYTRKREMQKRCTFPVEAGPAIDEALDYLDDLTSIAESRGIQYDARSKYMNLFTNPQFVNPGHQYQAFLDDVTTSFNNELEDRIEELKNKIIPFKPRETVPTPAPLYASQTGN